MVHALFPSETSERISGPANSTLLSRFESLAARDAAGKSVYTMYYTLVFRDSEFELVLAETQASEQRSRRV